MRLLASVCASILIDDDAVVAALVASVVAVLAARSSVRVGPQAQSAQNVFLPASHATVPDLGDLVRR